MGKKFTVVALILVLLVATASNALAQNVPEECPPLGLVAIVDPDTGVFIGCTDPADPCPPGFDAVFLSSFELFCVPVEEEEEEVETPPGPVEVSQELGQEAESGDVNLSFEVASSGDYAIQCAAPLQFANTANLQNVQGFAQFGSATEDLEAEGSSFGVAPASEVECNQAVQQSAAASN